MSATLPRCQTVLPRDASNAPPPGSEDTVTLDATDRVRRRLALTSDGGFDFLLDLPSVRRLRHGDGLLLDDDRVIRVRAAPEPLLEVRGHDALHLLRLAWHLGNRHQPSEIHADCLVIRDDHVLAAMLVELGAEVRAIVAPFDPEGGAYGDHAHEHTHEHEGARRQMHARDREPAAIDT